MTIDITTERQDKFGFYQVDGLKTYSKFEAIEHSLKYNTASPTWNFNESVFECYNWSQEPSTSLNELYRRRAQQLREKYDYLVLWFSGGADCTNILKSFVDNKIKLDEVASYVNYEATGDKQSWLNAEIFHVAVPAVEAVKADQPWLKHTIVDLSQLTMDYFSSSDAKFDWIYKFNHYGGPNNLARRDLALTVPHWQDMFDSGQRVGFIFGLDKPRITGINGQYYVKFTDCIDPAVTAEQQMLNRAWEFIELFYWSPDCVELLIKQAHVVKTWLKAQTQESQYMTTDIYQSGTVRTTVGGKVYYVPNSVTNSLIYPCWTPVPYQGKPPSLIFTLRDTWFFDLPESDSARLTWQRALQHRWQHTPHTLRANRDDITKGFKNLVSGAYYLGT